MTNAIASSWFAIAERDAMTLVELAQLVRNFLEHPPHDFEALVVDGTIPAFAAFFDLLTTADAPLKRFVGRLPLFRCWNGLLRPRTCFVGTTVSEYAVIPVDTDADKLTGRLIADQGRRYPFLIVKDLPENSPLLSAEHNAMVQRLAEALQRRGFVLMEGQALAYVNIDVVSVDAFLSRMSHSRRKDIRRKLRARAELQISAISTGDAMFADEATLDRIYSLYLNVFAQSEIQFDRLSREYFAAVLQDASNAGVMFLYRHLGELIGYNLCFVKSKHTHEPMAHTHRHVHDEHHQYAHDFPWDGHEPHTHPHVHAPLTHSHSHYPDVHHQHRHGR